MDGIISIELKEACRRCFGARLRGRRHVSLLVFAFKEPFQVRHGVAAVVLIVVVAIHMIQARLAAAEDHGAALRQTLRRSGR